MEKTYRITLANGTVLDNLTYTEEGYVSQTALHTLFFDNNCSPVTIYDGTSSIVHRHMELTHLELLESGGSVFMLVDKASQDFEQIKVESDVAYLSMMTDIPLSSAAVYITDTSAHYEDVKRWYDLQVWDIARVGAAVEKGWITTEEFKDITGYDY